MTLLLAAVSLPAQPRVAQPSDLPARQSAAAVLAFGLNSWQSVGEPAGAERLRSALCTARLCLPEGSSARARADRLHEGSGEPGDLARGLTELLSVLTFRPVEEAELPAGVPGFLALDELELRHYPAYRMARTEMRGGSSVAFWPLFRHIQTHEIAMTTPVQIDYGGNGERERQATMAFLYGSPEIGKPGREGEVEVVDVPPLIVLSLGWRGYEGPARVAEMRKRLEAWLADHPEWEVAGPLRTMGYNSPSVRNDKRYFEVQLPVRARVLAVGQ